MADSDLIARVYPSVGEVPAAEWDRVAGSGNPFMSHAFLTALEDSGSVGPGTGWSPAPLVIEDARGTLHPFAVECAAREVLGVRRVAALAHNGKRLLILEGPDEQGTNAQRAVPDALAWARLDEVVTLRKLPMDRRHNSKVDYPELRRQLARRS